MSETPVSAPSTRRPSLAVLYLPPILNLHADDELATLGRKLAVSLDKFAANNAAVYASQATTTTVREREEAVCRLTRRDNATTAPEPLADIFLVDYRPVLMARYRAAGLPQKVLLAGLGLIVMGWKGVWALVRQPFRVKRLRDRFQALYAVGCFGLVFFYLACVLMTALQILSLQMRPAEPARDEASAASNPAPGATNEGWLDYGTVWPLAPGAPAASEPHMWFAAPGTGERLFPPAALPLTSSNGAPDGSVWQVLPGGGAIPLGADVEGSWLDGAWNWLTAPWRWLWNMEAKDSALLLLVLTALGLAGGQGKENPLRSFINRASEEMLAFIYYLSFTDRRAEITGLVDARLEEVMESGPYERYLVIGYSFGTIVAFDAFCPASEVRARRLDRVDTLVTIAAPYDFILTYWPRYFADRLHAPPAQWLNIYSPVDLLGTCFDKAQARVEREQRLRARGLSAPPPGPDEPQNSFGLPDQLATGPTREFAFREGIPDEQLGLFGWVAMQGLGAHSRYWAKGEDGERNCFDLLVGGLFPKEVGGTQESLDSEAGGASVSRADIRPQQPTNERSL